MEYGVHSTRYTRLSDEQLYSMYRETVVFMHMRGISTEKGLKIVDDFLLNLKGNEHNKYG